MSFKLWLADGAGPNWKGRCILNSLWPATADFSLHQFKIRGQGFDRSGLLCQTIYAKVDWTWIEWAITWQSDALRRVSIWIEIENPQAHNFISFYDKHMIKGSFRSSYRVLSGQKSTTQLSATVASYERKCAISWFLVIDITMFGSQ